MKSLSIFFCTILAVLALQVGAMATDEPVGGGDVHYDKPVVGVIFSHDYHVNEAGMDCESCHDELFAMESLAAQEEPDFNMLALSEGRYCGSCHDGDTAFASNTRCASCHEGVIGYDRAMGVNKNEGGQH